VFLNIGAANDLAAVKGLFVAEVAKGLVTPEGVKDLPIEALEFIAGLAALLFWNALTGAVLAKSDLGWKRGLRTLLKLLFGCGFG
jgi:hypothetical protein